MKNRWGLFLLLIQTASCAVQSPMTEQQPINPQAMESTTKRFTRIAQRTTLTIDEGVIHRGFSHL